MSLLCDGPRHPIMHAATGQTIFSPCGRSPCKICETHLFRQSPMRLCYHFRSSRLAGSGREVLKTTFQRLHISLLRWRYARTMPFEPAKLETSRAANGALPKPELPQSAFCCLVLRKCAIASSPSPHLAPSLRALFDHAVLTLRCTRMPRLFLRE